MGKASPLLINHNAGEFSALMEGRVDIDKYAESYHSGTNFIPRVQGPAERRAGTRFIGAVADSSVKTLLMKFVYSTDQSYDIEFGDHYCRFFTNHARVDCNERVVWDSGTAYDIGTLVYDPGPGYFTAIKDVPAGTAVTDTDYWYPCTANFLVQAYEIYSPYAAADLYNSDGTIALFTEQSADVLYIAGNGNYKPYKLIRYSTSPPRWGFVEYAPIDGPFLDSNTSNTALYLTTSAGAGYSPGSYNLAATKSTFASTDVGRLIRLDVQTFNTKPWASGDSISTGDLRRSFGNTYKALNSATAGTGAPEHTSGTAWDGASGVLWLYVDSGYGVGVIEHYTSATSVIVSPSTGYQFPADVIGTTATITGITKASPCVITASNSYSVGDPVFITGVVGMTEINDQMYTITAASGTTFTISLDSTNFTSYSSGGTAIGKATLNYQLGAWSDTTGYPTCVCFFSDRLFWFKGIYWYGSVNNDYESHSEDDHGQVTTDMAMRGLISSNDVNTIQWASAAQVLLIGTQGGEFALSAITTTNPLGPDNVHVIRQSKKGCKAIKPELVGTTLFYIQRSGKRLFAMDYNFYIDRFDSVNQNRLNPQITGDGVVMMAWQEQPYEILWMVRQDGKLIGYTYDRVDNVTGFHEHQLGGNGIIECMTIKPSVDGTRDELTFIVKRTINGVTKRYIEYMEKGYEDGDAQSSAFYVDCGYTYTSETPFSFITLLNTDTPAGPNLITNEYYMEGQTLSIFRDGAIDADAQVVTTTGGAQEAISASTNCKTMTVGFACPAEIVYSRIEGGADVGTSQGKTKRIAQAVVRLYNTIGGKIGMENGTLRNIYENDPSVPLGTPPPIISGDKKIDAFDGDFESDCRIKISNSDPVPMTVIGIFPYLETNEPT